MKRTLCRMIATACIGVLVPAVVANAQAMQVFAGAQAAVRLTDSAGIDAFLSENRLDPIGDVLPGVVVGGRAVSVERWILGASAWMFTASSGSEQAQAHLYAGGGGFDVGVMVGEDEPSVLIAGAILGCGANIISVHGYPHPTLSAEQPADAPADGLVPEPERRIAGLVTVLAQPYVGAAIDLAPRIRLTLSVGLVLQAILGEFGGLVGVSPPALRLPGITISAGLSFGGIASGGEMEPI